MTPKRLRLFPASGAKVYDRRPPLSAYVTGPDRDRVKAIRLFLDGVEITEAGRNYGATARYFPPGDLERGEHALKAVAELEDGTVLVEEHAFLVTSMENR